MRVLVIRPALSGARTARKLEASGHQPWLLPLTVAVHDPAIVRTALDTSAGAIAVTSAEAIRVLAALDMQPSHHLDRPLFAVGRTTAAAAVKIGFSLVLNSRGDGTDLADLIGENRSLLSDQPVTYLAGSPRASGFEARLEALGLAFETVEAYRMQDVQPSKVDLQQSFASPVDAILLYSRHSTQRFFDLSLAVHHYERLKNARQLCLSAAIAEAIPETLRPQLEIAAVPEEDSLLDLLKSNANPILM